MHPVLHEVRAHLGVDYRAPIGAPVIAVANGVVTKAGWNGGGGRTVGIRHAGGYESFYLHLSSIAVRPGAHVSQGTMIGRVGQSGLATGPHLDYRLRKNGAWVNPVLEHRRMPPGAPIPDAELSAVSRRHARPRSRDWRCRRCRCLRAGLRAGATSGRGPLTAAPSAADPAGQPSPIIIVSMAAVYPFLALRPEPRVAADVADVPYDVVNTAEARGLAANRPLSFLHVSRAEIDLPPDTDPYADVVYRTAAANFDRLRTSAPLVVESRPSLYFYRLVMGEHAQTGLAACFSVDEYERDIVRKHERTRKDKEDDRTRHIVELRAQTGPVFLTYPASPALDALASRITSDAPLVDFTAADGIRHTIWKVPAERRERHR